MFLSHIHSLIVLKLDLFVISEMSRPGSGTVHASSNVAASHLLGNYLT